MALREPYPFPARKSGTAARNAGQSGARQRLVHPRTAALLAFMALGVMPVLPVRAAEWNIDRLMHSLAQTRSGHASFVEKKFITLLEKPIKSSGRLRFSAPDTLEMHTLKPKTEIMLVRGDTLTVDHERIRLPDHPELLAFIDGIRGTLTGNRQMLEQFFRLSLEGDENRWTLTMLPRQQKVAQAVRWIRVYGSGPAVTRIDVLKTDHDRSVITIHKPVSP